MRTGLVVFALLFSLQFQACSKKSTITQGADTQGQNAAVISDPGTPDSGAALDNQKAQNRPASESGAAQTAAKPATSRAGQVAFDDVRFDFDRDHLSPAAREVLGKLAAYIADTPSVSLLIEGHCDERGTAEYNYALGQRRANTAKQFLVDSGIDPKRISTISYGKDRPLDPAANEEAWAKNRRAHFVLK